MFQDVVDMAKDVNIPAMGERASIYTVNMKLQFLALTYYMIT